MTINKTFGMYTGTNREVGLDWHIWVTLAHMFRKILVISGQCARFCEKQARGF